MASIPVQQVTTAGVVPTFVAAANTDTVKCDGRTLLWVKNDSGGSINVTIVTTKTVEGFAVADLVVAVAAGAQKLIGPFAKSTFDNGSGEADIDYSATATVTRGAISY